MNSFIIVAATLLSLAKNGVEVSIESDTDKIDPGRSVFLMLTIKHPEGTNIELPDLRARARGFSVAEDFEEEPISDKNGNVIETVNWRLVPEPVAEEYKIAPFVVGDFFAGPVYFGNPDPGEKVYGPMEINPKKDMPPLSWRLVWKILGAVLALALVLYAVLILVRYVSRRVREHLMSPVERAWAELDRLVKKGLPGRGRYKDFYVELTRIVRNYVQRKYSIKAPHMTTEEFLSVFSHGTPQSLASLKEFLESADLVKFAGVEATPEMADGATQSARDYIGSDAKEDAR